MAPPRVPIQTATFDDERTRNRRVWVVSAAIAAVIALPVGVSVGMKWVDLPWTESQERAVPEWVPLPQLRATTIDGSVVKARVALDVESAAVRGTIQRRTQQVGLLLEVSVASRSKEQIRSPEGIEALSRDMRKRLNDYLESEADNAVRSVAIQDLIVNPQ
jgi:flagellar basal body-associated protein FliL